MRDILKLSVSLGLICGIVGIILVHANKMTELPRARATENARRESLKLVLPDSVKSISDPIPTSNPDVTIYNCYDNAAKLVACAAESSSKKGFGGEVKLLAGLATDGKILAVMVTSHSETPGIGTQVTDRKITLSLWQVLLGKAQKLAFPPNRCLDSYRDQDLNHTPLSFEGQGVVKITGATYTSTAVLDAINKIGEVWKQDRLQEKIQQPQK